MVAPLALIFMTQWMLLIIQMCLGWHCTNCEQYNSTWQSSEVECNMLLITDNMKCMFGNIEPPLHNGESFSITAVNMNGTYSSICRYIPQGMNGSAIVNFSCVIYNISFMNCTWQAGKDAPGDTQYFLYWQNSRDDKEVECELYIKDENGRNTGCRFQNVTIKTEKAYFLVNGTSKDSLIQFYDEHIQLYKIEKLMSPSNITVAFDEIENNYVIQWQRPQISHSNRDKCFKYEIHIRYKDNPEGKVKYTATETKWNNHTLPRFNPRKKYLLKMRAAGSACLVSPSWGEWSAPVEFGNEEITPSSVWILLATAVGTLLMAIIVILFCKKTDCWKAAFPQIPEPKNSLCRLADTNPELMERKIPSMTSEKEEIVLVADIVK